jgi:hypothetical protein
VNSLALLHALRLIIPGIFYTNGKLTNTQYFEILIYFNFDIVKIFNEVMGMCTSPVKKQSMGIKCHVPETLLDPQGSGQAK